VANAEAARSGSFASIDLKIGGVRPWSPGDPHLYTVVVEPLRAGSPCDRTVHRIGVRDVRVEGSRLLFNGEPVFLRGFGKHEDSPVRGRGLDLPLLVKDFGLLEWIGANSVRTSHYPYDESFLDLADERGVLVISEIPSINLDFRRVTEHTLATHERAVTAQIARDRNHPSVILWSLANEPGYLGEQQYAERSGAYWRRLFEHARALDPSRPLTCAQVQRHGPDDPVFAACDVLSINRYYGWYDHPGQLDTAAALLQAELDALAARHGKPILVAEFGADTVAGLHATYDQLFTEEYQEAFLRRYLEVIERHPATIGAHVWNFADFRTAQHFRRVVLNLKGVFTRTREPKRAAFALKELWSRAPARR
jgi:beta-glucuronidase